MHIYLFHSPLVGICKCGQLSYPQQVCALRPALLHMKGVHVAYLFKMNKHLVQSATGPHQEQCPTCRPKRLARPHPSLYSGATS